jgi:hypothetical protein
LPAFVADMPPRDLFVENFDDSIANEGTAVITRIPTTSFSSTMNDLANGWANQNSTASSVTVTLATKGYDLSYNVTQWATIGEQQILNTFANQLAKQVANGIAVSVMSNVTNSYYTNTVSIASSSLFNFTGSNSLQAISTTLDNLEIPQADRYAILLPNAYQSVTSQIYQQYVYGNPNIVKYNGFTDADGKAINSANPGLYLAGFNTFKYARLNSNTATLPYGGAVGGTKLAGFAGNKAGIAFAARTPVTVNNPLVQTYTVIDPTSGFPLQFILAFDPGYPGWRLGVYSLFGSAQGNADAIVPILTTSGF